MTFLDFFTDPVLRGPTWGTLWMSVASSLVGVVLFLKKKTLLAESLSHATYPGVALAISLYAFCFASPQHGEGKLFPVVLIGAFFSSCVALFLIDRLREKQRVSMDAALCFILAFFFGVGIVLSSAMQTLLPTWHKYVQMLLFGQAATMHDLHILLYGALAFLILLFFLFSYRPLQCFLFDPGFAKSVGIRTRLLERALFWLLLLSLILGIRSVGIVLMSGMIAAPAIAARQFTDRLHRMLWLAAGFGALSALFGQISSVVGSIALSRMGGERIALPTGPMIVLAGATLAFGSLIFAPKRGWLTCWLRRKAFQLRCLEENAIKALWKKEALSLVDLQESQGVSLLFLRLVLRRLEKQGWVVGEKDLYQLTPDGKKKGSSIVRLHRLWELYLTRSLQQSAESVHHMAEEMEHSLTPELEEQLAKLLKNPRLDPHRQPIPEKRP